MESNPGQTRIGASAGSTTPCDEFVFLSSPTSLFIAVKKCVYFHRKEFRRI